MYGNEAGEHRLTELAVVNCKKNGEKCLKIDFLKNVKKQQNIEN